MKEQTIKLIDRAINHLEQMAEAEATITFDSLVGFVQAQVWTKKPAYHNYRYIQSIAWIAWHTTNQDKNHPKDHCVEGK